MGFSLSSAVKGVGKIMSSPEGGAGLTAIMGGDPAQTYSAYENYKAQEATNKTNIGIANKNNATTIDLANTAHQREVKDLQAAGLNPVLSAGGSGSASPSMQAPSLEAPRMDFKSHSARERAQLDASIRNLNQDEKNKIADEMLKTAQTQNELLKSKSISSSAQLQELELDQLKKDLENRGMQRDLDRKNLEFDQTMQPFDRVINKSVEYLGGVGSALGNFTRGLGSLGKLKAGKRDAPPTYKGKPIYRIDKKTGELYE